MRANTTGLQYPSFSLCTRKAVERGRNCTRLRKVRKIWAENAGLRTAQLAGP
jgi:hypothetical protein